MRALCFYLGFLSIFVLAFFINYLSSKERKTELIRSSNLMRTVTTRLSILLFAVQNFDNSCANW
jgi:hypothetical protein